MKKIKITEKQAELLGLNKITENEESGLSVKNALGEVVIRVVISGDGVAKFKDRIIQLVARHDKDAKVGFFEQTGKIVGNIKEIKLGGIARDIKALDPTISVEKKPITKSLKEGVKKVIKISKEQYDRILAPLNENEVKDGLNRVDKTDKKEFAAIGDTKNLKEGDKANEAEDPIKKETLELIKYLYRKSEKLSPFWEQNGLSYDAICDTLLSKNMIVKNGGKYELAKTLGNPQVAIQSVEDELRKHIKPQVSEPEPELETESNYPAGADNDPSAPWNQSEPDVTKARLPKESKLTPIAFNSEVVLLKGPDGSVYVFYYDNIDKKDFMDYTTVPRDYVGKDEDGQPEYDYDFDAIEIDGEIVGHYVNDNLESLTKGEGLEAYENGVDLVKVDEPLKQELSNLYDKDQNFIKSLNPIDEEADYEQLMGQLKTNLDVAHTPKAPTGETPEAKQSRILTKLAQLKAQEQQRQREAGEIEEMTGTGSAGAFTGPMSGGDVVKREMPETPVVGETTVAGAGNFQYDAPGLANVGRNGEFKKGPKTKAQSKTQYAGGAFVDFNECTKLSNKPAGAGCSQGAVDNVVKLKKTKDNVNAPSLAENAIYEAIAKKTGKSLEEVKKIIESNF